jgi:hypothetical protein
MMGNGNHVDIHCMIAIVQQNMTPVDISRGCYPFADKRYRQGTPHKRYCHPMKIHRRRIVILHSLHHDIPCQVDTVCMRFGFQSRKSLLDNETNMKEIEQHCNCLCHVNCSSDLLNLSRFYQYCKL